MKPSMGYEAPSMSPEAIVHNFEQTGFKKTKIANAVQAVLAPKTLKVEESHTIADIERILGVMGLGQSLLLGAKGLIGKTLQYHEGFVHVKESGTKFAVRAANDERYALAA